MDVPNVIGDWQEYQSAQWSGLRVRVHSLAKNEPRRGRSHEAKGLTYARFHVTFENRGNRSRNIKLTTHPYHYDARVGPDGHAAFIDTTASETIRDYTLYPQRRVTATLYIAATTARLKQLDIQISPDIDDDSAFGYIWTGGLGIHEASTRPTRRPSTATPSLAGEIENYLKTNPPTP
ncbi:hypothetical protein ACFWJT_34735 [Streptomyces sp. NPDC127069]|uniref:hypothetical protein n=1 Tax=Streptomyces sp. NPDC127069 TaxID=3347128 RepID=UPI0036509BBD